MSLKKEADAFIAMPIVHFNSELRVLIERIRELESIIDEAFDTEGTPSIHMILEKANED